MRKVLLAKSAGFCSGVRRAVTLAQEIAESGAPAGLQRIEFGLHAEKK